MSLPFNVSSSKSNDCPELSAVTSVSLAPPIPLCVMFAMIWWKTKIEQRYQLMKLYLPALAWVTIAQYAMCDAFHSMIKKFTHNTTFWTLSNRIPSVAGRKILKRTEILLHNAAVHQTIFTVNPMTGSCHKTYHPLYQQ